MMKSGNSTRLFNAFSRPESSSSFARSFEMKISPKQNERSERREKSILWFHVILLFFLQSFPPVYFFYDEMKRYKRKERRGELKNLERIASSRETSRAKLWYFRNEIHFKFQPNASRSPEESFNQLNIEWRRENIFRYIFLSPDSPSSDEIFLLSFEMMKTIWRQI